MASGSAQSIQSRCKSGCAQPNGTLAFRFTNYALGAIGDCSPTISRNCHWNATCALRRPYIGSLSSTLAEARATIGASMLSGPRLYLLVAGGVAMIIFAVWIAQTARRSIEEAREHTESVES